MQNVKVKISSIQPEKPCRCGNSFQHWKNFSHRFITGCPVVGCGKKDIVGMHVEKSESSDKEIYIIPLCTEHSVSKDELEILEATKFVSADLKKTCGEGFMTYIDAPVL
jgi:hypothetical protein